MKVKFSDFKIIPDLSSIRMLDIDDDVYFSKKYRDYISNSRLKNIDPKDGGSPEQYKNPPHITTQSLSIGSSVHELLLQPDSFVLAPKSNKPTAKLGAMADKVYQLNKEGMSLREAIVVASSEINYYVSTINSKIDMVIEKCTPYWNTLDECRVVPDDVKEIFLSDSDYDTVTGCIDSCNNNEDITTKLHPTDVFGEPIESHNEMAFFIDFVVTYKKRYCATLKFKMKADNFTIDSENKIVTLNDLKTTGKPTAWFMNEEYGSMMHYHYYRQMYLYSWVLWLYCVQKYGASKNQGWKLDCNMLVVQTFGEYISKCYNVSSTWLKKGKVEGEELLKRVAAYEIFGWDKEIDFE